MTKVALAHERRIRGLLKRYGCNCEVLYQIVPHIPIEIGHGFHKCVQKVESVPVTVEEWHKQRAILQGAKRYSKELGFAMFFLNRTNRSGILDAGPIGGYDQSGTYKIDCRFNKEVLIKKISKIAECKNSVRIYNQDISAFLRRFLPRWKNSGERYRKCPHAGNCSKTGDNFSSRTYFK